VDAPQVRLEALRPQRPHGDALGGDSSRQFITTSGVGCQVGVQGGAVPRQRREARVGELGGPLVGVVRLEEERRFGAALGEQAVALPGVAVHGADRQGAALGPEPVARKRQQRRGRGWVGDGVVADVADAVTLVGGRIPPPQRAAGDGLAAGGLYEAAEFRRLARDGVGVEGVAGRGAEAREVLGEVDDGGGVHDWLQFR